MSYLPSSPPPLNPDRRELPSGWIEQYDSNYQAWFYVNTRESPPRTSWVHPLGPPPPVGPPPGFSPPLGPPPPDTRGGWGSQSPYPQGGYSQGPPQGGWGPPPTTDGWGPPPPGGGWQGSPGPGYYPQAPPQVVYVEKEKKKEKKHGGGMGMGTVLAAGGAGLLGGVLLEDAFDDHNNYEQQQGYDQGFQDGDFGGGSW